MSNDALSVIFWGLALVVVGVVACCFDYKNIKVNIYAFAFLFIVVGLNMVVWPLVSYLLQIIIDWSVQIIGYLASL